MTKDRKNNANKKSAGIELDDIKGIVTTNLGTLLRENSKYIHEQYTLKKQAEIEDINVNIAEFEESINAIKSMLVIYQSEYNESIQAISEFDSKIKYAEKLNDYDKMEEMTLVREYYTAKVMIISNEIELKNTRITLIEKMIEFLKVKLKNINVYIQ